MKSYTSSMIKLDPQVKATMRSSQSMREEEMEWLMEHDEQREALALAGVEAREHYLRTGLHLDQAEIEEWLSQILEGGGAPVPPCRA